MENIKQKINRYHDIMVFLYNKLYRLELVKYGLEILEICGWDAHNHLIQMNIDLINSFDNKTRGNIHNIFNMQFMSMYYIDAFKYKGHLLAENLLISNIISNKFNLEKNIIYYMKKLNISKKIKIDNTEIRLDNPKSTEDIYYLPMNPSIIKIKNGYIVNVRLINYKQHNAKQWNYLEQNNKIKSINYIYHLDNNYNIISSYPLIDKSFVSKINNNNINYYGYEDIILFPISDNLDYQEYPNELWFSSTCNMTNPINIGKIVIGKLYLYKEQYYIDKVLVLSGPSKFSRIEKNWITLPSKNIIYEDDKNNKFKFIYSHNPLTIVDAYVNDTNDNHIIETNITKTQNYNYNFSRFRGSSLPIYISFEMDNNIICGYLAVIHEAGSFHDNKGRYYSHRFILYDKDYNITYLSNSWYFDHIGVEFCRSMCYSSTSAQVVISAGIEDKEANLYVVNLIDIISMLHKI